MGKQTKQFKNVLLLPLANPQNTTHNTNKSLIHAVSEYGLNALKNHMPLTVKERS